MNVDLLFDSNTQIDEEMVLFVYNNLDDLENYNNMVDLSTKIFSIFSFFNILSLPDTILIVSNNTLTRNLFIIFAFYVYIHSKLFKKKHIAIDFEFYYGTISLAQYSFHNSQNVSLNFIVDPNTFSTKDTDYLINKIYINDKLYKILHGSDSLDVPYIYNILLSMDSYKMIRFIHKMIDTRYLCEYYKNSVQTFIPKKCSLYDALVFFNTISEQQYIIIQNNLNALGPIQNIKWNINNLNKNQIEYTYLDVFYSEKFLYDIFHHINDNTPFLIRTYYYILDIVRFVILDRKSILNSTEIIKKIIIKYNNIDLSNETHFDLNSYYKIIINDLILLEKKDNITYKIFLDFIMSVGYIKNTLNIYLKFILLTIFFSTNKNFIKKTEYSNLQEVFKIKKALLNEIASLKKMIKFTNLFEEYVREKIKKE